LCAAAGLVNETLRTCNPLESLPSPSRQQHAFNLNRKRDMRFRRDGRPAAAQVCLLKGTSMNKTPTLLGRAAIALALALVLGGCASTLTSPPQEITQRIESARTRSDHESLATYFTQEATQARQAAALHRKMAKSYQSRPSGERGSASMVMHCNAIAQGYENSVSMYEDMATSHRQMAMQVAP
jgi:hypothetical protein